MDLYLSPGAALEVAKLNFGLIEELLRDLRDQLRAEKPLRLILSTPDVWFRSLWNKERQCMYLLVMSPSTMKQASSFRTMRPDRELADECTVGPIDFTSVRAQEFHAFASAHRHD